MSFRDTILYALCVLYVSGATGSVYANEYLPIQELEELIVTAQKREQSLQDIPMSITALHSAQLNAMGVTSLDGLMDGVIPSLRISPSGNSPSSLIVVTRGDGGSDYAQPTREGTVAIYQDGIYIGRIQGLSMELADLKRVEVLRGPQGTLFGRNSTSGAVNLISNGPTGTFGIEQSLSIGNYDAIRSITRVNLPAVNGFSAKFDYMHSEREGWVENTLEGQADYNEYDKDGGKLSLNWQPADNITVDYAYDYSEVDTAQVYFQVYEDTIGAIGRERKRETKTRFPLILQPNEVDIQGHSVIASWEISESMSFKSFTSFRKVDEDGFNNYGGALYSGGIILDEDIKQEQHSQEFQLTGSYEQFEWVTGLYYFEEDGAYDINFLFSLDPSFQPIIPPVSSPFAPPSSATNKAESIAVYGQGTWSLNEKLNLTIGARYTNDDKSAKRNGFVSPDINSEHVDSSVAISYNWLDNLSTYLRRATAYRAGGYNVRSATFLPYDEEENKTWEIGLKSEWFERSLRFNATAFKNVITDKQFDFIDSTNLFVLDTLNAVKDVEISGLEIDVVTIPVNNLSIGMHYTYLDGDMPLQPHPDGSGAMQEFALIQTPPHAGAITIDYVLKPMPIGTLALHLDITATDRFAYSSTPSSQSREDAYTLVNGRITLDDIALNGDKGRLSIAAWGKNLTDEKYVALGFGVNAPAFTVVQAFGTPRTIGIDITYIF